MICTIEAAVSPFQAVSNRGETDKAMIRLMNLASVSLFQRFGDAACEIPMGAGC
jgi:hypothetical protein